MTQNWVVAFKQLTICSTFSNYHLFTFSTQNPPHLCPFNRSNCDEATNNFEFYEPLQPLRGHFYVAFSWDELCSVLYFRRSCTRSAVPKCWATVLKHLTGCRTRNASQLFRLNIWGRKAKVVRVSAHTAKIPSWLRNTFWTPSLTVLLRR